MFVVGVAAVNPVGGEGSVIREADVVVKSPDPLELIDVTVNVYTVPAARPVNVYGDVADVWGEVATLGFDAIE